MASLIGQHAVKQAKKGFGLGEASDADTAGGIQWNNFNYPPCINVIHFDPKNDNIPLGARTVIAWIHNVFALTIGALLLNVVSSIILAMGQNRFNAGVDVVFSILQLIIMSVLASYPFYSGYRGIAAGVDRNKLHFKIGQGVLSVIFIFLMLLNRGNIHGFAAIGTPAKMGAFFTVVCIVESVLWAALTALGIVAIVKVHLYEGHAYNTAREREQHGHEDDDEEEEAEV